ncbi:unnamed protein product [Microthlaspi erraticum]|uniref:Arabidopsis retrotransposon Orf1 C-terminal domain-containing protein n=1 Tax=Microthlaspi erraticum TaxID=1685480 RepID=A0A6D2J7J3_9BRAS|nr:unnamed protein product [Microthlaspi erraticum]
MHKGKHVYRFQHPTFSVSKVLLPNKELTSFDERSGIIFLPTADDLHMDGGDTTIEEPETREEGEPEARAKKQAGRLISFRLHLHTCACLVLEIGLFGALWSIWDVRSKEGLGAWTQLNHTRKDEGGSHLEVSSTIYSTNGRVPQLDQPSSTRSS